MLVGLNDQLLKTIGYARLGILTLRFNFVARDIKLCFADQLGDILGNVGDAMLVGDLFLAEDSFYGILLRHRDVLTDVLVCLFELKQIQHDSIVSGEHNQQLGLSGVHELQLVVILRLIMKRTDDMNGQILFTAKRSVIQFSRVGEILFVGSVPELFGFDDFVENDLVQFVGNVFCVNVGAFDLLFDILLFVGQELVNVTGALNVDLVDQPIEGLFNSLFQFGHVLVKVIQHQDAKVTY